MGKIHNNVQHLQDRLASQPLIEYLRESRDRTSPDGRRNLLFPQVTASEDEGKHMVSGAVCARSNPAGGRSLDQAK